jgi:acyl carrier protein
MRERLRGVFAEVFELPPDEIPDDPSVENIPSWDSLRQLELMLALELEFGVRVPTEAMLELQSLAAIEDFLAEHARV